MAQGIGPLESLTVRAEGYPREKTRAGAGKTCSLRQILKPKLLEASLCGPKATLETRSLKHQALKPVKANFAAWHNP